MRRQHPDPRMSIPLSLEVWQQLISASVDSGYAMEDWEVAAEAINQWTRKNKPDAIPLPAAGGYQWKSLFLPAGTLLRTIFGGKNYHSTVEGDRILYNGKPVSPSGFVNAVGGIRRNAWRCTWLLFPDSKDWKLADTLRTRARPRRARRPVGDFRPAPEPCAACTPVSEPVPEQTAGIAASASEAPELRRAIDAQVPQPGARGERRDRRQRIGINQDDRMTALLRQELLPLLHRMCACDGMAAPPAPLRA